MGSLLLLFYVFITAALQTHGDFHDFHIQTPAVHPVTFEDVRKLASRAFNAGQLIFGGQMAYSGLLPMQALLLYSVNGSEEKTHCAIKMKQPSYIMVGAVSIFEETSNTQERLIHKVYPHKDYDERKPSRPNDIAVVEFSPPVTLNKDVQFANILKNDDKFIKEATHSIVSGFGTYKFGGRYGNVTWKSPDLLYADVNIYNSSYCNSTKVWTKDQICAGAKGRGIGPGDDGGPISVINNHTVYQVGLASWSTKLGRILRDRQDLFPSVFTRVSHYCNIISKVTKEAFKCK
ncbi:hypothetical protein QR680_014493 [Steinernema hermaphroditum]|uniref:Peptidase S1 domain-containing protein n=1 Tax=Steinernema hermaphroditum TaxID=289476 RepID=A0AA39IB83_9BILA|nr:hypothetical protein QR680_014493 [Steinernema hermaphroditum]